MRKLKEKNKRKIDTRIYKWKMRKEWCVVSSVECSSMHRHNNCELNAFLRSIFTIICMPQNHLLMCCWKMKAEKMGIQSTSFRFADILCTLHTHTYIYTSNEVETSREHFQNFLAASAVSIRFYFYFIFSYSSFRWPSVCVQCKR